MDRRERRHRTERIIDCRVREIFAKAAATITQKARPACAKRLTRSYHLLGNDVAQANVESFFDAQVEALRDVSDSSTETRRPIVLGSLWNSKQPPTPAR